MRYAIYRIHYGLDFLARSIDSVYEHVDRVFVFWSKLPWYKNCTNLPPLMKMWHNIVKMYLVQIKYLYTLKSSIMPTNQFKLMNDVVVTDHGKPDQTLCMNQIWYGVTI